MYKQIITVFIILITTSSVFADDFTGEWKVVKVIQSDNYMGEIKYPKWFKIENAQSGHLKGTYKDQYDYENKFQTITLINNGRELLLSLCCETKHPESWAPLHKVKIIDGKLHAYVVTNHVEFEWIAVRAGK